MRINRHWILITSTLLASAMLTACGGEESNKQASLDTAAESAASPAAPIARIENTTDTHWGVEVDDPYRYMEDQDNPEVVEWFKGQAKYTESVLAGLPMRQEIYERLIELDQGAPYTTYKVRRLANGDMFYMRRNAGENLGKLYYHPADSDSARLLVDPETLEAEGEQHYSLGNYMPSWDGSHVTYGLAQGGSELTTYHIMEVASGNAVDAPMGNIETAYNRPMWTANGDGFYYSRRRDLPEDAPETEIYKQTMVRYHELGTDSGDDAVIAAYELSDHMPLLDTDFPSLWLTPNSEHAVLKVKHGDNNEISLFTAPVDSLLSGDIPWVRISEEADLVTDFAVMGNDIYLRTAKDAPRYQLIKTNLAAPDLDTADVIIAPGEMALSYVVVAKDALYIDALQDGVNKVIRVAPDKMVEVLNTPRAGAGYISSASPEVDGILLYETSWIQGGVRYVYEPTAGTFTDTGMVPVGKFDNLEGFVATEVLVSSHDGTQVPLSILHRADLKMDGSNPTIVYGYGSYGIPLDMFFSPIRLAWLERGGVFAIAHVRGGGEYGQEWHYAGRMANKPNTWLDLIACAEYLVDKGYTAPAHMAPMGGSAGGILAGRSVTTRPDLFGAAVMQVGMLDAIRAETTTNGVPNIKEFGTVTDEEGFKGLLAMSSYHHVREGVNYPATLLTHGYNDNRVNVWMSGKMAARLQAANSEDGKPVLLRVEFDAGHGIGSTRDQLLAEVADTYSFLFWQLAKDQH
jgi:prolyl oligopeptidase